MADSITAMGSDPKYFPLVPDWAALPSVSLGIARDYVSFPGTAHLLQTTTDLVPNEFTLGFMTDNKVDEYALLEFIHEVQGRAKRFWIEYPLRQFTLKTTGLAGATSLVCHNNGFEKIGQDNERIFAAMKNGDLLVRKVTESNYNDVTDELSLTIDTALDRDLLDTTYFFIGRFMLCRLSADNVKLKHLNTTVTTYSMKFMELPYEYDEEEAS